MNNLSDQLKESVLLHSAQNSKAWDVIRLGRFTGSGLSALFTEPKSKADKEAGRLSQTAMTYIETKAMEAVTGIPIGEFSSKHTDWGNEWEETAIKALAAAIGCPDKDLQMKPNFVLYGDYSGASPDAYMMFEGVKVGAEVKCPSNPVNHYKHTKVVDAATLKEVNEDYYWQVQANIFFNKMPLWIFASFDPRHIPSRRLHYALIYAVPEDIELMLQKLQKAEEIKQEIIKNWKS